MTRLLIACIGLGMVAACAHQPIERPEPVTITTEVQVPVAVPCAALAKLGPEPAYADTDAAIAAAPDVFETARVYAKGRLQRMQRLAEYGAARVACVF